MAVRSNHDKAEKVREIVESLGGSVLGYSGYGYGSGSYYMRVTHPNKDEVFTIRFADHAPPRGRGGYVTDAAGSIIKEHSESDLSFHPGGLTLPKAKKALEKLFGVKGSKAAASKAAFIKKWERERWNYLRSTRDPQHIVDQKYPSGMTAEKAWEQQQGKRNPMTDRVTLTETYKTGKGAGVIVAESGKVRGPYKITAVVGNDRKGFGAPKSRKIKRLGDARAALRGKLGPLRKASNPNEVIRLVLGEGEGATVSESVPNPLNKYYFQRGDGGLILRKGTLNKRTGVRAKGRPLWVGSLDQARRKAQELHRASRGRVKITILRVEPDGDQTLVGSVGNPKPALTRQMAWAAATDAGNRSMRKGGRTKWDEDDYEAAVREFKRLWPEEMDIQVSMGRKRNPNGNMADADRLYEDFHGRPPTQTTRVVTRTRARTDLAELGPLTELKVHLLTGKRIKLPYEVDCDDQVMLCSSPDGRQLYFVGGDQTIDLRRLGMSGREWVKDSMVLGVLEMVTYRTEKGFDKFKLTDYYHELGEESGMQPLLMYDNINGLLSVAGGQYEVRPEGIVN